MIKLYTLPRRTEAEPKKCAERGCLRQVWEDSLCWWCYQAREARNKKRVQKEREYDT